MLYSAVSSVPIRLGGEGWGGAQKFVLRNHLAEVVRSKPRRPVYRGKRHIPPFVGVFGAIRVPYLKGLNRLFNPL